MLTECYFRSDVSGVFRREHSTPASDSEKLQVQTKVSIRGKGNGMRVKVILNPVPKFKPFVYGAPRWCEEAIRNLCLRTVLDLAALVTDEVYCETGTWKKCKGVARASNAT